MGCRRHRSKRELATGKPHQSADNPLGAIGRVFQFLVKMSEARSAERSKFLRLCDRQNIRVHWEESRMDEYGKEVPTIVRIAGIESGLRVVAAFIDTHFRFHSEILITSAIPHVARGTGELSESAARFGRLNRHQKREIGKNAKVIKQAEAASKAAKVAAEAEAAFHRAVAYNQWLLTLPEAERAEIESRNERDAEAKAKAKPMPDYSPLNGAPKPRVDLGKLPPVAASPLTVLAADALTFGLKEYYATIVEARRIAADAVRIPLEERKTARVW